MKPNKAPAKMNPERAKISETVVKNGKKPHKGRSCIPFGTRWGYRSCEQTEQSLRETFQHPLSYTRRRRKEGEGMKILGLMLRVYERDSLD